VQRLRPATSKPEGPYSDLGYLAGRPEAPRPALTYAPFGHSPWSLMWSVGWLVLVTAAVAVVVEAVRRRQVVWAVALAATKAGGPQDFGGHR
jgi:hypothetical protein